MMFIKETETYVFTDSGKAFELIDGRYHFIGKLNGRTERQFIEDIQNLECGS